MPLHNNPPIKYFYEEVVDTGEDLSYSELLLKIQTAYQDFLNKGIPDEKITFEVEYEDGLHISGSRPETPIEQHERELAAVDAMRAADERDLATYQRLRAKFETPSVELP
jgi:hypothetical protein